MKSAIAKVWEKKYVFCTAGASRGPFGTEKKMAHDDFAWRIEISRSQGLKSSGSVGM